MKIDINKRYRTKNGYKVTLFTTAARGESPVVGIIHCEAEDIPAGWSADGGHFENWNLVEDHPVDVDKIPPFIKWLALDSSGSWYGYNEKPCLSFHKRFWEPQDTNWSTCCYAPQGSVHAGHKPEPEDSLIDLEQLRRK